MSGKIKREILVAVGHARSMPRPAVRWAYHALELVVLLGLLAVSIVGPQLLIGG